jgi:hypothetical protein
MTPISAIAMVGSDTDASELVDSSLRRSQAASAMDTCGDGQSATPRVVARITSKK